MNPGVYTRPAKPLRVAVQRREEFAPPSPAPLVEIVAVDRATECHVTPPDVARRMVRALGPQGDYLTLEPSAGTGNLSRALIEAGHSPRELVQVERHHRLAGMLHPFGTVLQRCFLEYADEVRGRVAFARIIMNPPFRDVRKHVAAARSLLAPGGVLVALVPVTFDAGEFETLETLGPDTFAAARVNTKIIRITH